MRRGVGRAEALARERGERDSKLGGTGREHAMLALKYLLMILGVALFGSAGALVAYDVYVSDQLGRLLARNRAGRAPKHEALVVLR